MAETLVPLIAIICLFGLPIGGWIAKSYFSHRERMELIRQGINPRDKGAQARGPRPVPPWESRSSTWQAPPIVVADASIATDPQASGGDPNASYPGARPVGPNVEELKRPTPPPAQRGG